MSSSELTALSIAKENREFFERNWPLANTPARAAKRIAAAKFEGGDWGRANAKLGRMFDTRSGTFVALTGLRGTGKTQLAVCAMERACRACRTVKYIKALDFFCEIKGTYSVHAKQTEKDVIDRFSRPHLLVVDGVEERGNTEWEDRMLSLVIDRRYDALLDTILITNQREEEFLKSIGPSAASRLRETGGIVVCAWPSFRDPERMHEVEN